MRILIATVDSKFREESTNNNFVVIIFADKKSLLFISVLIQFNDRAKIETDFFLKITYKTKMNKKTLILELCLVN